MEHFYPEMFPSKTRCDKSVENSQWVWEATKTQEFDFQRFTLYLKLRNGTERKKRLHSLQCHNQIPSLVDFTDDVLANELCSIYGHMDKQSERFKKILNTYKDQRLEEIAEWIHEEKKLDNQLHKDLNDLISDDEFNIFSKKEIEMFQELRRGAAGGSERFILPRIQEKDFSALGDIPAIDNTSQLNLAEFDPQVQLPQCVPTGSNSNPNKCTIRQGISSVLQQLSYKYPFGITPTQIISLLEVEKGKKNIVDFKNLGYNNLAEALLDQHHIFWPQKYEIRKMRTMVPLIFPTYLEGLISTPMEILWKILHQLKIILSLSSGIVKVKDAIILFEQIFGFKLNDERVQRWGFTNSEDLVQFLFKRWSHSKIKCLPSSELQLTKNYDLSELYLTHYGEASAKLINRIQTKIKSKQDETVQIQNDLCQLQSESQNNPKPCMAIPVNCVQNFQELDYEMFGVKPGRDTKCKLATCFNPCFFFVNLSSEIDKLEEFQLTLSNEYKLKENENLRVKNPQLLKKNLPLVAWDESSQEFYRVLFDEEVDSNLYKVRSIDFGFDLKVGLQDIWFLSTSLARKLPGQAIPCQLYNVLESRSWDKSVEDYCYKLLNGAESMTVAFKERLINEKGRKVYLVRVAVVNGAKATDAGDEVTAFIKEHQIAMQPRLPSKITHSSVGLPKSAITKRSDGSNLGPSPMSEQNVGHLASQTPCLPRNADIPGVHVLRKAAVPIGWSNNISADSNRNISKPSPKMKEDQSPLSGSGTSSKSWAHVATGKWGKPAASNSRSEEDFPPLR